MTAPTSDPSGTPAAEVTIDRPLVEALLRDQCADLASLPLSPHAEGWDNSTWRLGDELAVRLPRRAMSAGLIRHEQKWLPVIARRVSLRISEPVRCCAPAAGYPWSWSVVRWTPGVAAIDEPPRPDEAARLGQFLAGLHLEAPAEAPRNPYRGVPLAERAAVFEQRLQRLRLALDDGDWPARFARLEELWSDALAAPIGGPAVWLHGDLHPKNVIVRQGRLAAVIDWGDVTGGDAATDLAALWMLFPLEQHQTFWQAYGMSGDATRRRAAGWAAMFGVILLETGLADDAKFERAGRDVLTRLCG